MNQNLQSNNFSLRDVLKYYFQKIKGYKGRAFCYLFCIIFNIGVSLYLPILTTKIIERIGKSGDANIASSEIFYGILSICAIWGIIECIQIIVWKIQGFNNVKLELYIKKDIENECFSYILNNSYRFFSENFAGSLSNKVSKFSNSFSNTLSLFSILLEIVLFLPATAIIMFTKNFLFGIIFLGFAIIFALIQYFYFKREKELVLDRSKEKSKYGGLISDVLTNNFNILTFSTQKAELNTISGQQDKIINTNWTLTKVRQKRAAFTQILTYIFKVGVVILALFLWYRGVTVTGAVIIDISLTMLVYQYSGRFTGYCYNFRTLFSQCSDLFGDTKEMRDIFCTPHEITDKTKKKLKVLEGKINFENITFGYNPDNLIFQNFDLKIKPEEKIALVGRSGSGKTSLIRLLFRFFDLFDGKILIDGQDISHVTQESLRNQISMVPQDVILFHRSLRENICYGNPKATEKEMIAACKMAKCHDFISKLKDGYDTLVGERGIKLSGGERQRVAIARAILENKKILVLDEATSALDSESEILIQKAIKEVMKNKTVIIIAHRLSTIKEMDKIIVMDKGKIIEKGSHTELLMDKDGTYTKFWDLQSGGFLGEDSIK